MQGTLIGDFNFEDGSSGGSTGALDVAGFERLLVYSNATDNPQSLVLTPYLADGATALGDVTVATVSGESMTSIGPCANTTIGTSLDIPLPAKLALSLSGSNGNPIRITVWGA